MKIVKLPLTDSFIVTVFKSVSSYCTYSVSRSGYILYNKNSIATDFSERYTEHIMVGTVLNMDEAKAKKIFDSAGLEAPYIDYQDRTRTFDSALDSFKSFLLSYGWNESEELTWIVIPKPSKNLTGKKFPLEFSLCDPTFKTYGNHELEVFMSNITKTSKSITFSVKVPKYIYDKCMTDPDVEKRPKLDYIEVNTISALHTVMEAYCSQASLISDIERDAQNSKKILCINFNSSEMLSHDEYNHGYTGQRITINYNYFVAYKVINASFGSNFKFFTYKKYLSGVGISNKGIKGIVDSELSGGRQWLMKSPQVYIDWTQEREDFLNTLETKFRSLSENLKDFLDNLDEDKIELLIANANQLKLLS